jgi:hypothetical protein
MYYNVFVLGYDLLHDILNGIECDVAYEICESIYEDFVDSDYNNLARSEYEGLSKYIQAHMNEIKAKVEELQ